MKPTIITSIYGRYDQLREPVKQSIDCDFVCVNDGALEMNSDSMWKSVVVPSTLHPRMAAKTPKMNPWLFADGNIAIWIDAAAQIISPTFVEEILAETDQPLAQFKHPERDCIYDEALASYALPKYANQDIAMQVERYTQFGFPRHWGLWATGLILWNISDETIRNFGRQWLEECYFTTYQDQISEPFVLSQCDIVPQTITKNLWENDWVSWPARGERNES